MYSLCRLLVVCPHWWLIIMVSYLLHGTLTDSQTLPLEIMKSWNIALKSINVQSLSVQSTAEFKNAPNEQLIHQPSKDFMTYGCDNNQPIQAKFNNLCVLCCGFCSYSMFVHLDVVWMCVFSMWFVSTIKLWNEKENIILISNKVELDLT